MSKSESIKINGENEDNVLGVAEISVRRDIGDYSVVEWGNVAIKADDGQLQALSSQESEARHIRSSADLTIFQNPEPVC